MAEEVLQAVVRAELDPYLTALRQIESNTRAIMSRVEGDFQRVDRSTQAATRSTGLFAGAVRGLAPILGGLGAARVAQELGQLASASVQASVSMQALQRGFVAAAGGAQAGGQALAFVRAEADRIGVAFGDSAAAFRGFLAATRDTALEGQGAQRIFSQLSETARNLGLSNADLAGTFRTYQQILSRTTVQTEEMNQLTERIPGVFRLAADALGITQQKFRDFLEQGRVLSEDFIPKLTNRIEREFVTSLKDAKDITNAFQIAIAQAGNAFPRLLAALGDIITRNPAVVQTIQDLTATLNALTQMVIRSGGAVSGFIAQVATQAQLTMDVVRQVAGAFSADKPIDQLNKVNAEIADTEKRLENLKKYQGALGFVGEITQGISNALIGPKFTQENIGNPFSPEGVQAVEAQLQALRERRRLISETLMSFKLADEAPTITPFRDPTVRQRETFNRQIEELKSFDPNKIVKLRQEIALLQRALAGEGGALTGDRRLAMSQRLKAAHEELQTILAGGKGAVAEVKKQQDDLEEAFKRMTGLRFPTEIDRDIAALSQRLKTAQVPAEIVAINDALLRLQQEKDALTTLVPDIGPLRDIQDLRQEIERTQAVLANPAQFNLDASMIPPLQQHLSDLQDRYAELTQTLEQRINTQSLDAFGDAMGSLADDIREGMQAARSFAEQQASLALSMAETPEAIARIYSQLLVHMKQAGATLDELAQKGAEGAQRISEAYNRERDQIISAQEDQAEGELRLATIRDNSLAGRQQAFDAYIARLRDLGTEETRIQDLIQDETQRRLEEEARAFQDFSQEVQNLLGDTIFDVLSGKITSAEDAMESFRDTAFRVLADLGSQKLTEGLIAGLEKLATFFRGGGTIPEGQTGLPQQTIIPVGGAGIVEGGAPGQQLSIGGTTQDPTGIGTASGITAGQIGSAIGLGVATGMASTGLFEGVGLRGRANSAVSGLVGGAIAGTQIYPGWGTVIGAVLGGVLGAFTGKDEELPRLAFGRVAAPGFQATPSGVQFSRRTLLSPDILEEQAIGEDVQDIRRRLQLKGEELFLPVLESVNQLPDTFQRRIVGSLNQLSDDFEDRIDNVRFRNKNIWDNLEDYISNDVPREFEAVFGAFVEAVKKVAPVARQVEDVVNALRDQQEQMIIGIQLGQKSIQEGLFTPAQSFERRQRELQRALTQFEAGDAEDRLRLAPRITELAQVVFGLAKNEDVLGQDIPALRELQTELLKILEDVESETRDTFIEQRDIAKEQLDVLLQSLTALGNVSVALDTSNEYLDRMAKFFDRAFQGQFAEGGTVPRTGMALVHAGELIVPANVAGAFPSPLASGLPVASGLALRSHGGAPALPFVGNFQTGGVVPTSGLALVHAGERVMPAPEGSRYASTTSHYVSGDTITNTYEVHVEVHTGGAPVDGQALAGTVMREIENRARLKQTRVLTRGR